MNKKKTYKVTDVEKSYAQYKAEYVKEKDTEVGMLSQLAFGLRLSKGNKVTIGDLTFKPNV